MSSTTWCRAAVVATITLAACSGEGDTTPDTTAVATTSTIASPTSDDGRLTLGILLPSNEPRIGEPLLAATRAAVAAVNDAGGLFDEPVRTIVRDEGSTPATAAAALEELLDRDVDAIVGPASSNSALGILDEIVDADVLACSPTASSLALDGFPDEGLFVRTIPSDSVQADVIAEISEETGAQTAVVAHVDDAYGRPFSEAVEAAFDSRPIALIDAVPFSTRDDDLSDEAQRVAASEAAVAIVIGTGENSASFLAALDATDTSAITTIVVNDAIRDPAAQPIMASLEPDLRERVVGVAPQALPIPPPDAGDESDPIDGPFAANAFDCVNLIALASVQSGSTDARVLAGQFAPLSADGSVCATFATCRDVIDRGLNPNYVGPSGVTEISGGSPTRARYTRFVFDDDGRDVTESSFVFPG